MPRAFPEPALRAALAVRPLTSFRHGPSVTAGFGQATKAFQLLVSAYEGLSQVNQKRRRPGKRESGRRGLEESPAARKRARHANRTALDQHKSCDVSVQNVVQQKSPS